MTLTSGRRLRRNLGHVVLRAFVGAHGAYVRSMTDRTDAECRLMLEACGFAYDPARDSFSNGTAGRELSVDTILAHTQLWVAKWITRTLPARREWRRQRTVGPTRLA